MSTEEISAAIETLQQAGIQGLEHLCLPISSSSSTASVRSASLDNVLPLCDSNTTPSSLLLSSSEEESSDDNVTRNIVGAIITVCCIAVAAGLFLGLMTLDVLDLQIIVRSSVDEEEIKYAKTLLPIVRDRHRLLVTLLLMDTLA